MTDATSVKRESLRRRTFFVDAKAMFVAPNPDTFLTLEKLRQLFGRARVFAFVGKRGEVLVMGEDQGWFGCVEVRPRF